MRGFLVASVMLFGFISISGMNTTRHLKALFYKMEKITYHSRAKDITKLQNWFFLNLLFS